MKTKKITLIKFLTRLVALATLIIGCNQDDRLDLQQDPISLNNTFHAKNVNANEIPDIMNFVTTNVAHDLTIRIDGSQRKDIVHTRSETNIIVGQISTDNVKTVTDGSGKTNYSFKIEKEEPSDPYFMNLIVKETNEESYAYIVKYEYAEDWEYTGDNLDTFKGKKVFYSSSGKYLAKYDIDNEFVTNEQYRNPCPPDDSSSSNGGPSGGNPHGPGNNAGENSGGSQDVSISYGGPSGPGGNSSTTGPTQDECLPGWVAGQLYVVWHTAVLPDGTEIKVQQTVDCTGASVSSSKSKLGGLLKMGDDPLDANGDCIPDYEDDGYDDSSNDTANSDENDFDPINVDLGLIVDLYNLTGQTLSAEENLWVSEHPEEIDAVISFLEENPNSDDSINASLMFIKISEMGLINGPYDTNYFNIINPYTPADLNDPVIAAKWLAQFSVKCAILKFENPTWSNTRVYWEASKEMIHIALDIGGMVPVIGIFCDITNGVIYAIEGDGVNATLSFVSAIPVAGWFSTGAKYARKTIQVSAQTSVNLVYKVLENGIVYFGSSGGKLRAVLGITDSAYHAHHLMPWATRNLEIIQKAAKSANTFHLNEALNGIPRPSGLHLTGHNIYNNRVIQILTDFNNLNPNLTPSEAYDFVVGFADHIRGLINANPGLNSGQIANLIQYP